MNNKNVVSFMFGAIVGAVGAGSAVHLYFAKKEVERIRSVNEELSEIEKERKEYQKKASEQVKETTEEEPDTSKAESIQEYRDILKQQGYARNPLKEKYLYILSPGEFGSEEDYEPVTLTYYADDVLADEDGDVVVDRSRCVGNEFMNHFGDYEEEPDTVYIRNHITRCDYEILRDTQRYSDVYHV